ncbi:MAG: hypothetical protein V2A73_10425 [Pseudomonadota bacterium]
MRRVLSWRGCLAACLLVTLSALEVYCTCRARSSAPTDGDWRAAAALIAQEFQPGDLIVFVPQWSDQVGRKWLGSLMSLDDVARMDDAGYQRTWEVVAAVTDSSSAGRLRNRGQGRVVREQQLGRIRVRLRENPGREVLWQLHANAPVQEVGYEPHRCVRLPDLGAGSAPARLGFPGVSFGTELVVYAGLADFRTRRENYGRAAIRVLVDETEVARATLDNESGWLGLPPVPTTPGEHHLAIEAEPVPSSSGQPARLAVCVAAEARR